MGLSDGGECVLYDFHGFGEARHDEERVGLVHFVVWVVQRFHIIFYALDCFCGSRVHWMSC